MVLFIEINLTSNVVDNMLACIRREKKLLNELTFQWFHVLNGKLISILKQMIICDCQLL